MELPATTCPLCGSDEEEREQGCGCASCIHDDDEDDYYPDELDDDWEDDDDDE